MEKSLNQRMLELFKPGRGTMMPGAHNALSARIMEAAGFETVLFTGAGFANTYLGVPDMGLTSLKEVVDQVAAISDAIDIPILADGDTGFGNALNARRTVRMMERAGASALLIEDQVYPKRCGHFEDKSVISKSEMVQKLKAAVDARQTGMLILARTDARAMEGLDAAIDRARAYSEAGADLLFVEAPQSLEELARIPRELAEDPRARLDVVVDEAEEVGVEDLEAEAGGRRVERLADLEELGLAEGFQESHVLAAGMIDRVLVAAPEPDDRRDRPHRRGR